MGLPFIHQLLEAQLSAVKRMTAGSWSTKTTTNISTSCSVNSVVINGTNVSWNGADGVPGSTYRKKPSFKERQALFVVNPLSQPYSQGRFKLRVERKPDMTDERWSNQTIFDVARSRRIREAEYPEGQSPTPGFHNYTKSWDTQRQRGFFARNVSDGITRIRCPVTCGYLPTNIPDPWTSSDDYKLIERLRSKVTGSEFNLAVAIGAEGRETVKFIFDTASRVYRSALYMKKLNPRMALKTLQEWGRYQQNLRSRRDVNQQLDVYKDLSAALANKRRRDGWRDVLPNQWLEYHLAVEPLLGDIKAGAEALAHNHLDRPVGMTLRTSRKKVGLLSPPAGGWSKFELQNRTVEKHIVAHFQNEPSAFSLSGLFDPEVVIWNALPLSFVFDYMYDVGGFLEARATRAALGKGTFITSVKDTQLNAGWKAWMSGTTTIEVDAGFGADIAHYSGTFTRTVSTTLDVPAPRLVPLGAFQSWQRALTVLSLGVKQFGRILD